MEPGFQDKKKKPYLSPTLTKLTPDQARKLVVERTHRNHQEAADLLQSLRLQQPHKEEKHAPKDAEGKKRQRSA
jgi:hypothetical protein